MLYLGTYCSFALAVCLLWPRSPSIQDHFYGFLAEWAIAVPLLCLYNNSLDKEETERRRSQKIQGLPSKLLCLVNAGSIYAAYFVMLRVYSTEGILVSGGSVLDSIGHLVVYTFIHEWTFYFLHRVMHTKYLYSIHKWHHISKAESFFEAFYLHPLDNLTLIFSAMFPSLLEWKVVGGLDECFLFIWMGIAVFNFVWSHGHGRSVFLPETETHFLHHKLTVKNFSGWMTDSLFGTYRDT